ncbi:MAG TPA: hypothetical protein VIL00_10585 [Pseudonocardiaceae bacterium]
MNNAAKLVAYATALVLVAGGAWGIGALVGPVAVPTGGSSEAEHGGSAVHPSEPAAHTGRDTPAPVVPAGLSSVANGYTFAPLTTTLPAGGGVFAFRILGPDGRPVTTFETVHEKPLHLVVVRRDTAVFRHVHPTMAPDGTWQVHLDLLEAGSYRAFADFTPTDGPATTLGTDLAVPGTFTPHSFPISRVAEVDGYRVHLAGDLVAGGHSTLTVTVTRDGRPVTDLQPYLGAYGHLVVLRTGDLAYVHVHPEGVPGDGRTSSGPDVTFSVEVPTAGTYRLYLDFAHEGVVRTVDFTLDTGTGPGAGAPQPSGGAGHGDHDHDSTPHGHN